MARERGGYSAAGVDLDAADRSIDLIRARTRATARPEVLGDIGAFAGLFAPRFNGLREPVLVSATDGVGTKLAIAQTMDRHDTVGIDLVAMVVDDIVCHGAEPLFLLDYVAVGRLVPERVAAIVGGIAEGCKTAGCALLGGETAEHPGTMDADAYDLAAFGVGVADRSRLWGPDRVRAGDAVIGLASSGLHSNGYSLVRKVILDRDLDLGAHVSQLGRGLGDALLEPTRIYAPALLALRDLEVRAAAHVTGGGIAGNLVRCLPDGLAARLDAGSWPEPPIFGYLREAGDIPDAEMRRTFNMGLGMLVLVEEKDAQRALALVGEGAFRVGRLEEGEREVTIR